MRVYQLCVHGLRSPLLYKVLDLPLRLGSRTDCETLFVYHHCFVLRLNSIMTLSKRIFALL